MILEIYRIDLHFLASFPLFFHITLFSFLYVLEFLPFVLHKHSSSVAVCY